MRTVVATLLLAMTVPLAFAADPTTISVVSTGTCPVTGMVSGPPGVLWLDCGWTAYAKLTTATGALTFIPGVHPVLPSSMVAADDGSLFAASALGIVHIALSGEATLLSNRSVAGLALDDQGNVWFVNGHTLSRLAPSGTITDFPLAAETWADSLVFGPDRNLWFTDRSIARLSAALRPTAS